MPSFASIDWINAQLTQGACQLVILHAAQLLAAQPISDEQAAGFLVLGSDEVLCHAEDDSIASLDERRSYERWQCCRALLGSALCADTLTLRDCIVWLTADSCQYEDDDCVTYEQVMSMVFGPLYPTAPAKQPHDKA
jgi:hypothetical protein